MIKINDICAELNITSRALRYWEEKGLIKSIHENSNAPRYFEETEVEKIKKIIFLRKLGLGLTDVGHIISNEDSLQDTMREYRAFICSEITSLQEKLTQLKLVMEYIDSGKNIFACDMDGQRDFCSNYESLARKCALALVEERYEEVCRHFTENMKVRLLPAQLHVVWSQHINGMGKFQSIDKITSPNEFSVVVHLEFEKNGITVKFIVVDGLIAGLWLNYYR